MKPWFLALCLAGWMQAGDGGPGLALAAPSIQPLGVPAGGDFTPTDVNSDGSVIVGTSRTPSAVRGVRWTAAGGFQDLGSLGGDIFPPLRVSGQGDVVVGVANVPPGLVNFRIFRWTAATGMQDLGPTFGATPASISNDGTTMAALLAGVGPVRWTAAQGFTPISVPSVADPYDISGDGSVVVANDFGIVYTAYRWTAAGGAVALPNLGGCSNDRIANSISSNGAVTVGYSTYKSQAARPGDCPPMAVRWNGTTIQQLGFLPNGFRSNARGVSADGSVVVGYSNSSGGQVGFVWKSATNKMQDLNQVVAGVPGAAGRLVTDAIAVSNDGNVIAAIALNMTTLNFESVRIVLGGAAVCTPTTCAAQGKNCGSIADGCGGTLTCGTCTAPQTCGGGGVLNECGAACTPTTCAAQGKNCGSIANGCGGTLNCGICTGAQTCGGGGVANVCGAAACTPTTCAAQGKNCGTIADGCGGTLNCGACTAPQTCGGGGVANVCGVAACTPTTCAAQGKNCGSIADGCGGTLNCGACTVPQTCGGGGVTNVCGAAACTPTTCAAQGKNCGTIADGCGGTLNCGACTAPQTCGGGGAPNVCGAAATTATLTLTATGRGGEIVSSTPAGLSVPTGSMATATFAVGTGITLQSTNQRDVIWSGVCSSGGQKVKTCVFTLNANATETANVQ